MEIFPIFEYSSARQAAKRAVPAAGRSLSAIESSSGWYFANARWMAAHPRAELLSALSGDDPECITLEIVAQAARLGDAIAQDILAKSADHLAQGIAIYASLFDNSRMVVGGEVAELGDVYLIPLIRAVENYRRNGLKIEIIPAALKQDTFLRGISMLSLQEVLWSQVNQAR